MGLLALGTPLNWEDSIPFIEKVKTNGITQLLNILGKADQIKDKPYLWGDELEYLLIDAKNNKISVDNDDILTILNTEFEKECKDNDLVYHPEYGRYMIEATPYFPYNTTSDLKSYLEPELNMVKRKKFLDDKLLKKRGLCLLEMPNYPRLGSKNFLYDYDYNGNDFVNEQNKNIFSQSLFLPDEITNRHPRFPTLTANIRKRRNRKVNLQIPMYKDEFTPKFDDTVYDRKWFDMDVEFVKDDAEAIEKHFNAKSENPLKTYKLEEQHIYIDAMGFGMGACCLQTTYQAPDMDSARYLYDSLANFTSVLLALSAGSPFWKGYVSDWDTRWEVVSASVDSRLSYEENNHTHDNSKGYNVSCDDKGTLADIPLKKVAKSRYSKIDLFLGSSRTSKDLSQVNDVEVVINEKVFDRVNKALNGDENLAKHFAHLFIRDPIVIFEENVDEVDGEMDHFENINSTNWQSLRFKVPHKISSGSEPEPGFRVEFRPLEIQLSDFENAAFAFILNLIVQFILNPDNNINFYIPMSKVWANFDIASERNSLLKNKFEWITKLKAFNDSTQIASETTPMTADQIMHNPESGIISCIVNAQLKTLNFIKKSETWEDLKSYDDESKTRAYYYIKLLSDRSKGILPTDASWQREYVMSHPSYKKDSKVTEEINFDLINLVKNIHCYSPKTKDEENWLYKLFGEELGQYLVNHKL